MNRVEMDKVVSTAKRASKVNRQDLVNRIENALVAKANPKDCKQYFNEMYYANLSKIMTDIRRDVSIDYWVNELGINLTLVAIAMLAEEDIAGVIRFIKANPDIDEFAFSHGVANTKNVDLCHYIANTLMGADIDALGQTIIEYGDPVRIYRLVKSIKDINTEKYTTAMIQAYHDGREGSKEYLQLYFRDILDMEDWQYEKFINHKRKSKPIDCQVDEAVALI